MNLRDDLKAFLDGELPPERMAEIQDALDRDPDLAQEVAELTRITNTIHAIAAQPAAIGLEDTLRALGRAERPSLWRWIAPLAATAAAIAVITILPKVMDPASSASPTTVAMNEGSLSTRARASNSVPEDLTLQNESADVAGAAVESKVSTANPKVADGRLKTRSAHSIPRIDPKAGSKPAPVSLGSRARPRIGLDTKAPAARKAPLAEAVAKKQLKREAPELTPSPMSSAATQGQANKVKGGVSNPLVVEVDSPEDAEAAIRILALELGGQVSSPDENINVKATAKAGANAMGGEAQLSEKRLVLEVDEDRIAEARKRIPDAVREERVRREAMVRGSLKSNERGLPGETQSAGQTHPPLIADQAASAKGGFGARGGSEGRLGGAGNVPYGRVPQEAKANEPTRRNARSGSGESSNPTKSRRRLDIILKIRAKPPGKIDE